MRSVLGPAGYKVARARIPVKLLAVRTGLAQYGRNNIAYVRNLGSFVRLDAFCTDAPLHVEDYKSKGSWRLSSCPPCRNCHHVCPTGCIPYDGKVIDAERCLTYLNEHEGEWPEWLDPRGHNSLVGCMLCQEMCPVDRVLPAHPQGDRRVRPRRDRLDPPRPAGRATAARGAGEAGRSRPGGLLHRAWAATCGRWWPPRKPRPR